MRQLAVFMVFTFVACGGGTHHKQRVAVTVKSAIAQSNSYSIKDFVGLSTPDEAVNLAFKVSGQITKIPVAKGMVVSRGELLAELDSRDFELQVASDKASYEQAMSRLNRTERLLAHDAVSRAEAEMAESEFARVKSMYENSKDMLIETKLRSPFKALVEHIYVDVFQRIQSGTTIIRVVSPTSSTVEFTLPESSLFAFLDSTTLFRVNFDAFDGVTFDAKIKEYAKTSSDASGYPVALTISNIEGYTINSGMSCTITMMIANSASDSVAVPLSAIYAPIKGGDYVWVIGADNRVTLQSVTLGELMGQDMIVINGGVSAGSRVVSAGVYQLQNGEQVKVVEGL